MKYNFSQSLVLLCWTCLMACGDNRQPPSRASIDALEPEKRQAGACGPAQELGTLQFALSMHLLLFNPPLC